jgi:tRNA A-37 threonylcarbamoyl transferase component Bud32
VGLGFQEQRDFVLPEEGTEIRVASDENTKAITADRTLSAFAIPGVTLVQKLGQGGMAVVYEALDQGFMPPRRVAVKFMSAELSADPEFRARFEREAATVAAFRHDNIVHVYACGEIAGAKYIVMEYLSGGTLAQKTKRGPVSVLETIQTLASLADALAYSHSRGIVHRDFKPANVLLTEDGKPVLSDFGVAKATATDVVGLTRGIMAIGAPPYMSPEQLLGEPVGERTDVYSLGVTLLEMLSGQQPSPQWGLQRGTADDEDLRKLLPSVPNRLVELIRRCLQLRPSARPSAVECREELTALHVQLRDKEHKKWIRLSYAAIAVGVVFAGVALYARYFDGAKTPSATPNARLVIQTNPASAKVYVDGVELRGSEQTLTAGNKTVVAVAPGFYGAMRSLTLPERGSQQIEMALQPVALPTVSEYERFGNLANEESTPTITAADVESIDEPTLRTALRYRLLEQGKDVAALDQMSRNIDVLARYGDARAPVVVFLAESMREGFMRRSMISDRLLAAAERGDAMASFFTALALKDELLGSDSEISPSDPEFQAYCARLARASKQGWADVAGKYFQLDGCGIGSPPR